VAKPIHVTVNLRTADTFNESKVKRDHGKFASTGGGSGGGAPSAKKPAPNAPDYEHHEHNAGVHERAAKRAGRGTDLNDAHLQAAAAHKEAAAASRAHHAAPTAKTAEVAANRSARAHHLSGKLGTRL
jgi:hypothetical protein